MGDIIKGAGSQDPFQAMAEENAALRHNLTVAGAMVQDLNQQNALMVSYIMALLVKYGKDRGRISITKDQVNEGTAKYAAWRSDLDKEGERMFIVGVTEEDLARMQKQAESKDEAQDQEAPAEPAAPGLRLLKDEEVDTCSQD